MVSFWVLSLVSKSYRFVVFVVAVLLCGRCEIIAQEPFASVFEITAGQRLALEQIDQLVLGDQVDEAVELIIRTIDEADGRLVAVPRGHEVENDFVRYVPLDLFLQDRLLRWGVSRPELLRRYRRLADQAAELRFGQISRGADIAAKLAMARRVLATSFGDDALLAAADAALERGWAWSAIGMLRQVDPRWQVVEQGVEGEEVRGFGWELVLPKLDDNALGMLEDRWGSEGPSGAAREAVAEGWPLGCYVGSDLPQAEVGLRLLIAYASVGEVETVERLGRLLRSGFGGQQVVFRGETATLSKLLEELLPKLLDSGQALSSRDSSGRDSKVVSNQEGPGGNLDWRMLGRDGTRVYRTNALGSIDAFPRWVKSLEVELEASYELPEEPMVGWSEFGVATGVGSSNSARTPPIIHRGLVLVQKGARLFGMRLDDGRTWPDGNVNAWCYQHSELDGIRPASGVMPVDGHPWFMLAGEEGRVVGRFGPSESGWLQSVRPVLPVSELVMFDVERESQVVSGYPIGARKLYESRQSTLVEFEGAPLIVGRRMYVGLSRRDDATLTSSLACYDVASGELIYETEVISSARPLPAAPASRMASSLVSYREGMVYYHGDSGAVAAVDAEDGGILWLVRYPRAELDNSAYPRRRRAAGGRANPVALLGALAIVGPADLDRLMALDAFDGRMVWATGEAEADDADQVLGEVDGQIIVGGDSLYRLDRSTGTVMDRWPAGTTQQIHGALPQPRRQGRGLMAGQMVYWPTSEAIWVFDASTFVPVQKVDLRAIGMLGGDLAAAAGMLVISDGRRVAAFEGHVDGQLASATKD